MKHFTYTDRLILEKYLNAGISVEEIAVKMGRWKSTIYREKKRGEYERLDSDTFLFVKAYSADIAQADADFKATSKGRDLKLGNNYDYANMVAFRIKKGESPDMIVGSLRREGKWSVSTPTLYRYIENGYIPGITNADLLVKRQKKKRSYHRVKPSRAPKGTSIEKRPSEVDSRDTFGHWELDSVVGKAKGKHQSVLVLTERMTRKEIIWKVPDKSSASTVRALRKIQKRFGPIFKTITVDNGSEFADAEGMAAAVLADFYYCHPYTSCERGSNENCNRLIRRYLPKGKSLRKVTQRDCDRIAEIINAMPRKILGYRTAQECFEEELARLA